MGALVVLAWTNRFVQDDAFISFRYAEHLVRGDGLVWNPGERVEGYTNFLWTLLLAVPIALGGDPVVASQALGLACFAASLLLLHRLAFRMLGSVALADLAVLLAGTQYTFSCYATGGLETQMQVTLVLATALGCLAASRGASAGELAGTSLLAAGAVLTRPDSVLPVAVLLGAACVALVRAGGGRGSAARLAALLAPAAVLGALYAAWKLRYYGALLPNTFHAKTSAGNHVAGLRYLGEFLSSYSLWPLLFVGVVAHGAIARTARHAGIAAVILALWCGYVALVGGDFMEFRFLVLVVPILALLLAALLGTTTRPLRAAVALAWIASSAAHMATFTGSRTVGIESVSALAAHLDEERWVDVGKALGEAFGALEPDVVIAVGAAGAIPYYSGLRAVDVLGLTEESVARTPPIEGGRPGHQRRVSIEHLLARGVHLLVVSLRVHPLAAARNPAVVRLAAELAERHVGTLPADARVVALPIGEREVLHAVALVPHPELERLVAAGTLAAFDRYGNPLPALAPP